MRSTTSKGILVLCAATLWLASFTGSASAGSDVYWDGWGGPGYVQSYPHTATSAGTRTISGDYVCVQGYHASSGTRAGPVVCNSGVNQIARVNYPCACTLLIAVTSIGTYGNFRARISY